MPAMTSRPVFLLKPEALAEASVGAVVTVTGTEGRHGSAVRRLRVGDLVDVVDGAGRRVTGCVNQTADGTFDVRVAAVSDERPPDVRITVVQALAKGDRAESAVEMLTECGVDSIVPWSAGRSVSVWRGDKAMRGPARWRAVAEAATKQSRRSRTPFIGDLATTRDVAALLAGSRLGLVLHETAAARLSRLDPPGGSGDIVVVVGPEGGITDDELTEFEAVGALTVRLGESVLRTSTAGVAAAAVVLAASGRWD